VDPKAIVIVLGTGSVGTGFPLKDADGMGTL
jgi:hypothetical protein